jgi:cardiolipin synthase A/B
LLLAFFSLAGCSGPAPAASAGAGAPVGGPVRLWQDSSIFSLVGGLVGSARRRVLVEMYELGRDEILTGLGSARSRGDDVRVLTDPTVAASRASAARLDALGVAERAYPVDDARGQIDHVKLLVADGVAVIGGMNWGRHSDRNHDYVLQTAVATDVTRAVRVFEQDWSLAGAHPAPLGSIAGDVAQTAPGEEIRTMLLGALRGAAHRVLAEVYTLTDGEVIAGLAVARRRGADVRVLLDPNQPYNRRSFAVLQAAGVAVRWYPVPRGTLLHAKIGLFDGALVLGSANWTWSGLDVNHELDVETQDRAAAAAYGARFESDWARSA